MGRHSLVSEDWELDRQYHSSSVDSARSGLVGITCSPVRSSSHHSGNGSHAVHRCVQLGLGSPTRLTLDSGTVVSVSINVTYKHSGDAGRHQRSEGLPASSEVQSGSCDVRQRSHSCLHEERGGHLILLFHAADDTPAEVVRSQGHQAGASPSPRSAQCPGGCTVQDRPDSQHRVDVGHGTSITSVLQVGRAADRHVCYVRQQTTDEVCLTISGPQGRVDRCDVHYLGQREGPPVCVPTIQVGPTGAAEDLPVSRSTDDIGSSQARNSFLVSRTSGTVAKKSNPTVRRRSAAAHPRRHSVRRRDGNTSLLAVKSPHAETLRAILRAKGHSRGAADMMSRSLRQSSMSEVIISVYISHAFIQRRIASIDHHLTSHVSGFCAASLEVRSYSGSAHQAAHQGIQAGMICTTPNYA